MQMTLMKILFNRILTSTCNITHPAFTIHRLQIVSKPGESRVLEVC